MPSKDGKGRTLWDVLSGQNRKDMSPMELQYHNPLTAKVGQTISFDHEPTISGINFVIEKMGVYETKIQTKAGVKKFYHTDYHLKGVSLSLDRPLRFRLRLVPDEGVSNAIGHKIFVMHDYHEQEFDEGLIAYLGNGSGEFQVNQDDDGKDLPEARKYWRIEDVLDPYHARVTVMTDSDGNGKIDDNELTRSNVTYWDYHRDVKNVTPEYREYLTIEMDDQTKYIRMFRGREVDSSQIVLI